MQNDKIDQTRQIGRNQIGDQLNCRISDVREKYVNYRLLQNLLKSGMWNIYRSLVRNECAIFGYRTSMRNQIIGYECNSVFRVNSYASQIPPFSPQRQRHFIMPSKRTTSPPLNDAEKMLMVVAIRISAATKYREEHPHLSDPNFGTNLSSEAVRRRYFFITCCLIIFRIISLKSIISFHFRRESSTVFIPRSLPLELRPNWQKWNTAP